MLTRYVLRGVKAGIVAGLVFGLFVAFVQNPLIAYAETYEEAGHGDGPVVSGMITDLVSIVGGVLFGVLLGAVVFGVGFYFLEPTLPGSEETKSLLLAGAGFVTVSGAPWLVLPPQPPGVTQALPTDTRIIWYLVMMITGACACGLSVAVFNRVRDNYSHLLAVVSSAIPFLLIGGVALIVPENAVSGPIPDGLAGVFRMVTAIGQVGLWFVLASVHAWRL